MSIQKRVFIVHGWDGHPKEGWFPWLKQELEAKGFKVFVPQLPQTNEPRIQTWIPKLKEVVGIPDKQTYFVGHSMGCQAIARYLETMPEGMVGGVVFVAGFFKRLTNLENDETVRNVADEWLKTPLNFKAVRLHLKKSIAIFSDDDPYVPLDNQDDFRDLLGSEIIIQSKKGHFSEDAGVKELPVVLSSVLKMAEEA